MEFHVNRILSVRFVAKIVFLRPRLDIPVPMPYPHHGIGYVASILRENGHEVHFIDCAILNQPYSQISRQVESLKPDAVGITAISANYSGMKKLSQMLHKRNIPIILGGIHVTTLPELSLRETKADFAVLGEGELTILELMNNWQDKEKRKQIKGIAYIENDQFIKNPDRELIQNLDELPFPAWDLINPLKYSFKFVYFRTKRLPTAVIFTSRGCPHSCAFCASTQFWKHQFRKRSPQKVVDEIEYLAREYGIREIQIGDDYFNYDKQHVIEICREILRRKLDLTFQCTNGLRIENIDRNLLTIMRKTGFYEITIAVESGSQSILNSINKGLNLKKLTEAVKLAKSLGFFLQGFLIFGLPGETYKTVRRSIQFMKSLPFDVVGWFTAKPLPGSRMFDQWVRDKDPSKINYDWFHFVDVGVALEYSDGKRTIKLPKDAVKEYLLRPRQLLRYLKFWIHTFHFKESLAPLGRLYLLPQYSVVNKTQNQ
jgi:anaerobic magnesium-protoporphyrin IX monomethyl ester cyclase